MIPTREVVRPAPDVGELPRTLPPNCLKSLMSEPISSPSGGSRLRRDKGFCAFRQPLVVFAHPPVLGEPGEEGPLHYPPLRQEGPRGPFLCGINLFACRWKLPLCSTPLPPHALITSSGALASAGGHDLSAVQSPERSLHPAGALVCPGRCIRRPQPQTGARGAGDRCPLRARAGGPEQELNAIAIRDVRAHGQGHEHQALSVHEQR
jgi:hypothetical protein